MKTRITLDGEGMRGEESCYDFRPRVSPGGAATFGLAKARSRSRASGQIELATPALS